jgi:hypothetical protein
MQGEQLARFRRLDLRQPHVHHDALELANGRGVLVTRLRESARDRPAVAGELAVRQGRRGSPSVDR